MVESTLTTKSEGVPLYPGEVVCVALLKDVTYLCPYMGALTGRLVVTNYKLYFYQGTTEQVMFFIEAFYEIWVFFGKNMWSKSFFVTQ